MIRRTPGYVNAKNRERAASIEAVIGDVVSIKKVLMVAGESRTYKVLPSLSRWDQDCTPPLESSRSSHNAYPIYRLQKQDRKRCTG